MNDTVRAIIDSITKRYDKPQVMAGHHLVKEFYDCAQLTPNDMVRLAAQATGGLAENYFDAVVGMAYSGLLFSCAVAGGRQVNIFQVDRQIYGPDLNGKKVLVVDDVISTGGSMQVAHNKAESLGAKVVAYACIIDRTTGPIGTGKLPLYSAFQSPLHS